MKVSQYRAPQREEIPNLPKGLEWTDTLLSMRDRALKEHTRALQGRLDFENNFNCEVRLLDLLNNTEVEIQLKRLNGAPLGVIVLKSELYDFATVAWKQSDTDKIKLKVKWDSSPTGYTEVTLLILGS